jgi:hypothetical protein
MNASVYIEKLTYSVPCVKYKAAIQTPTVASNIQFKDVLSLTPHVKWNSMQTINGYGPTTICEPSPYREILLPKYSQTATDELVNTKSPTEVCQTNTYKNIIKRVNCNLMKS